MRLHARSMTAHVEHDHGARRPIVLRLAGLRFCLSPDEAQALADQLHDANEEIGG